MPGPLTYGVMADDTVAYLDEVVGGPAHLVGWSDGAVLALLVDQRRPGLVDRLVLIGQYCNSSGKVSGGLTDQLTAGGAHGAAGRPRRGDPGAQCRRGRGPTPGAAGRPPGHPHMGEHQQVPGADVHRGQPGRLSHPWLGGHRLPQPLLDVGRGRLVD